MTEFQPRSPDFRNWIRPVLGRQPFMQWLGVEVTCCDPGLVELAIRPRPEMTQHTGDLHAGVIAGLADNAAGGAAGTLTVPEGVPVTVEYKINFLAPARGERILARAQVLKPGRTLLIVEARVTAENRGETSLVATMLATMTPVAVPGLKPPPG